MNGKVTFMTHFRRVHPFEIIFSLSKNTHFAIVCAFNRLCTCIRNIPNSLESFFASTRIMGKVEILRRQRVFSERKKRGRRLFYQVQNPQNPVRVPYNFAWSLKDPSNINTKHHIRLRLALVHLKVIWQIRISALLYDKRG